ncbi:SLATT domain-containing protein [Zafaria sp. Z1313]|uniref:SLATT domain-containing protein n=1 Tax=unclassified Zafaria TaxID=2828765 RepID=UPI002E773A52|nr:SLATT domain-containing protein [Zafaria sp. J156]MEE1622494.1 SLATT domain-containing protein [Zafaria sp. J156]
MTATADAGSTALAVPNDLAGALLPIAAELSRLEENARYSQQSQFEQSKIWRSTNLQLGIPAAVLAAVAGTIMLVSEEWQVFAAIVSLLSAALATTTTTLSAERRSDRAATAANAYRDIQMEARQLLLIDLGRLEYDDARDRLRNLTDRYAEISRGAEPVLRRAYVSAKKNLAAGGQTHSIDTKDPNE